MSRIGCSLALLLLLRGQPAHAQSRLFVSGSVFADTQRFSGESSSPLNETALGAGGGVGALVSDRWDVSVEMEVGGTTTRTRPLLPPVTTFQSRTRTRIAAASALVGFHAMSRPHVQFIVLGGLTFLQARTRVDSVPSGILIEAHTNIDNVAAPTVGAEVPIMLGPHFSIVPALRVHAFTLRTDVANGFAIRPGIGVRWTK